MNKNSFIYESHKSKSSALASNYNKTDQALYRYLAYRDIPALIQKNVLGKNALDYGSGTGISTQFLINQGFIVTGVDTSKGMLEQACVNCPSTTFYLIENGSIPLSSETYDLIFSSFVLLELKTKDYIIKYLQEAKRVLKKTGVFIAVTGSQEMYSKNWICLGTNFPENKKLVSGDKVKVFVPETNMEFTDYYWNEADYLDCFKRADFTNVETFYPRGKKDEPYSWEDEIEHAPFVIFIAKLD